MTKLQQVNELIREAQGAINAAVSILHSLTHDEVGVEAEIGSLSKAQHIIETCAEAFQVSIGRIQSSSRAWSVFVARSVALMLIREHTRLTLSETARTVGKTDHGTVMYAVKRIREICETEPELAAKVQAVRNQLRDDGVIT